MRRKFNGTNHGTSAGGCGDCWVEDWNAEVGKQNSMGRLTRDVRRQERTDMRNRFLSIDMDAKFVSSLVGAYRGEGCAYPVFANLRNGLWYGKDWDGTCYFKSTDGHSGRWAFSYTRLNMHLAAAASAAGGCIVVDSTRAGKRFPDSLTATMPIWCCLLNRLASPGENGDDGSLSGGRSGEEAARAGRENGSSSSAWDTALHTPRWLSASEASQIEDRMSGWIQGLGSARAPLVERLRSFLRKPLRAVWLSPESRLVEGMLPACSAADLSFTPVICVSASKVTTPEQHRERHSWTYLQGAGDDEEHWSCGITPELFWANSERLVGLANGGDRSAFEAATAALIARTKKTATAAAAAAADGVSTDGGNGAASRREGGAPKEGNSSIGGGGAKSGEDGGHRGVEERWQPGGPDVHAVLGATGLVVCSLAYAAASWASQGEHCSLLNLSDQAFPEKLVRASTGPSRRYLHIPLKEGKKANPPRHWQTKVFPAALAFIAWAVGGVSTGGRQGGSASPQAREGLDGSSSSAAGREYAATATARHSSAVSAGAGQDLDGQVDDDAERQAEGGMPSGGRVPGSTEETAGAAGAEPPRPSAGGACASLAAVGQAGSAQFCPARRRRRPEEQQQQQQQQEQQQQQGLQQQRHATTAPRGKCLVACPTGAEASVIVCLCALVAFFSPPPTTGARGRTAPASGGQPQSSPQSSPQPLTTAETHDAAADDGEAGQFLGGSSFSVLQRRSAAATAAAADVVVTKAQLRWRFLLLQQECPWARPPRRLMQGLNEYLMTPGEHSWWTLSDRLLEESGLAAGHLGQI